MDDAAKILKIGELNEDEEECWLLVKPWLTSDADLSEKVTKITSDISALVRRAPDHFDFGGLWLSFKHISDCTPADHPWQELIIQVVASLSRVDGPHYQDNGLNKDPHSRWKALPEFGECIRDDFCDPTDYADEEEGFDLEKAEEWKNFSSFISRLGFISAGRWFCFALWQLETDLEKPVPEKSPLLSELLDMRLSVDTEWLLYHSHVLWEVFHNRPTRDEERMFRPGPLAKGVGVYSVERWHFWKRRLREIVDRYELESSLVDKISRTVDRMNEVEERWDKKMKKKARRNKSRQARSLAKRRAKRHSRRQARR